MKLLITSCFIAIFALGLVTRANTAHAAASSYKIEVVLFKHLSSQGKNSEYWIKPEHFKVDAYPDYSLDNYSPTNYSPDNDSLSTRGSSLNEDNLPARQERESSNTIQPALARYDIESHTFSPLRNGLNGLSSNHYNLAGSAAHIRQSKHFKLLAHFGWTQPSLSENRALPILITKSPYNVNMPEGEIKLHVSRFLHMNIDLAQTECVAVKHKPGEAVYEPNSTAGSTTTYTGHTSICTEYTYQFKQHRKMRSKELHYLDNPVFGMLVYITPI